MTPATRALAGDLGVLLLVPGLVALTAVVVALVAGERALLPAFALTTAASASLGGGLRWLGRRGPNEARAPLGTVAVALGWLGAAALAAIPFALLPTSDMPLTPTATEFESGWNALFEGMSALTSTGLTVSRDPSELPASLQWWRSSLEWVGGMGVALLALTFAQSHASETALVTSEINVADYAEKTPNPVAHLWGLYAAVTLASVGLLWAVGMRPWEALNHGLTGIATGGFSVTSDSFRSYGPLVKAATIAVMTAGALDFAVLARAGADRSLATVARDPMMRLFGAIFVVGALALIGATAARGDAGSWLDDVFIWTSAIGTCGFASVDLSTWSSAAWTLLIGAMFVGASAGSTGGGVKIQRGIVAVQNVVWQVRGRHDLTERHYAFPSGELAADEAFERLRKASALVVVFVLTLFFGALALMLVEGDAHSMGELVFEAASALGAVGLSSGVTGPDLGAPAKAVLIVLMWLGRLEVMAALMILAEILAPRERRANGSPATPDDD